MTGGQPESNKAPPDPLYSPFHTTTTKIVLKVSTLWSIGVLGPRPDRNSLAAECARAASNRRKDTPSFDNLPWTLWPRRLCRESDSKRRGREPKCFEIRATTTRKPAHPCTIKVHETLGTEMGVSLGARDSCKHRAVRPWSTRDWSRWRPQQ